MSFKPVGEFDRCSNLGELKTSLEEQKRKKEELKTRIDKLNLEKIKATNLYEMTVLTLPCSPSEMKKMAEDKKNVSRLVKQEVEPLEGELKGVRQEIKRLKKELALEENLSKQEVKELNSDHKEKRCIIF